MQANRKLLLFLILALSWAVLPGCGDDDPTGPRKPAGPTILILSDGGTEGHVASTLRAAGYSVRDGGLFYEFKGEGLADVDAVVLLAGVDYNHDMDDVGEGALVAFVNAGGGLLATEWLNYSISRANYHQVLKSILPVTYGGRYGSGSETYSMLTSHEVTKGLPDSFVTKSGMEYSVIGPRSGATQLVWGSRSGAAVVGWTKGGRVVSWNMAGQYGSDDIWNEDLDRLLVNCTHYVSRRGE